MTNDKKYAYNKDSNHEEIVAQFRHLGYEWLELARAGHGVPDGVVSTTTRPKEMWLVEIKRGNKADFTQDQLDFMRRWRGKEVIAIRCKEDVTFFHEFIAT